MSFQEELQICLAKHKGIAIEYQEQKISYEQLLYRADAITASLLERGITNGAIVGVFVEDPCFMIYAMIGIMNARCVFVPLDVSLPAGRLNAMVPQLEYVVCSKQGVAWQASAARVIYIEESLQQAEAAGQLKISYPLFEKSDSIYIYFTSGSTGVPKGIIGRNQSLLQFVKWELNEFGFDEYTRVSQFISPYFDAFLRDVFLPLFAGGTLCIPPPGREFLIPEILTAWINKQRISLIHCVPSFFRIINHSGIKLSDYPDLKYIMLSGERIAPAELQPWYDLFDDRIQLVNFYGATESTMIRSFYRIRPADAGLSKISIGKAIAGTDLVVLDKLMKNSPALTPGDLFVFSDYLSNGYFNNEALNKDCFFTLEGISPVSKLAYRTGDKARKQPDGRIELLGREDRQVKLRGIRVEPEEIENLLVRLPYVKNAAVVLLNNNRSEADLHAFIVADTSVPDKEIEVSAMLHLKSHLPGYMLPAAIHEIDRFPLLANGKVNYMQLSEGIRKKIIVSPENDIERTLYSIWLAILGATELSTDESFQAAGGNSIAVMKLIGRIYTEFNVRISLELIFNNPTIQMQAVVISKLKNDTLFSIAKAPLKEFYHVSSAQSRVYYNYELNKTRTSYNLPMAWEIKGTVDVNKTRAVLNELIQRHEVLRTRFGIEHGQLVQWVASSVTYNLEELHTAEADIYEVIMSFIRPFDLAQAPLFRAALIFSDTGRVILLVDLHHIICDGMSQRLLQSDFYHLYYGKYIDQPEVQYKDYAEWEYQYKQTDNYLHRRQFWLQSFSGTIPQLSLPVLNANENDLSEAGDNIPFEISKDLLLPLLANVADSKATVSSVFFSMYYLFLAQLTGQDDIVIGVASSGRVQQELETVVGMFVKTLPVRCRADNNMSFLSVINELHHHLVQAISNQMYDLEDIITEVNAGKTAKVSRLFNAGFVVLNFSEENETDEDGDFINYRFLNMGAKNALTLYVMEKADSYYLRLEYAYAYFSQPDVELLISQFKALIASIASSPDLTLLQAMKSYNPDTSFVEDDISFNF